MEGVVVGCGCCVKKGVSGTKRPAHAQWQVWGLGLLASECWQRAYHRMLSAAQPHC